jgi:hypothetical protein
MYWGKIKIFYFLIFLLQLYGKVVELFRELCVNFLQFSKYLGTNQGRMRDFQGNHGYFDSTIKDNAG